MYTNLRFNKGKYTLNLYAPPSQKPPFSEPKNPLEFEMQHVYSIKINFFEYFYI